MSNQVYLVRTKFENISSPLNEVTFGVRLFDDYDSAYNDCLTFEDLAQDNLKFLKFVYYTLGDREQDIIDHAIQAEKGIFVDNEYLDFEQIKDYLYE